MSSTLLNDPSFAQLKDHITTIVSAVERFNGSVDTKEVVLEVFEEMLNATLLETLNTEIKATNLVARKKMATHLLSLSDKMVKVKKMCYDPCRRPQQCYDNAYVEYVMTGNPIVYGLVQGKPILTDNFYYLVPHAFNYDASTNTYYDTTPFQVSQKTFLPAYIINSQLPEKFQTSRINSYADIPKSRAFLTRNDKTYVVEIKTNGKQLNEVTCLGVL